MKPNSESSGGFDHLDNVPPELRSLVNEYGLIEVIKLMNFLPGATHEALSNALARQRRLRQEKVLSGRHNVLTGVATGVND